MMESSKKFIAKDVIEHGRHMKMTHEEAVAYLKEIGVPERSIPEFANVIVRRNTPYTITTK